MIYNLEQMDTKLSNSIRATWIEQVEQNTDSSLEIINDLFDNVITEKSFGDLFQRSNQNTYIAIRNNETNNVDAVADIIFVRVGAETRCKIMDIHHAPIVSDLSYDEYIKQSCVILLSTLAYMLSINKTTKHGLTKIYARDDSAVKTLEIIKELSQQGIQVSGDFEMKINGYRWLEFVKKST